MQYKPRPDFAFYKSYRSQVCTVQQGVFQCVSVGGGGDTGLDSSSHTVDDESDSETSGHSNSVNSDEYDTSSAARDTAWYGDSDSDTETDSETAEPAECDGKHVDCYSECWQCASESSACRPAIEECLSDSGCEFLYNCRDAVCCGGANDCLVGEEMEDCMNDCMNDCISNASSPDEDAMMALYRAINECIACDACAVSCGKNESEDFVMCVDPTKMNTVDNPCYEEDAYDGETACYTWAGSVGLCAEVTANCKNNDACETLERCINDTWRYDDWHARQDVCFEAAGAIVEELYWDYVQCIYCDACDVACLKDAGSKNCDEYEGK